ncbi:alpha/beta hydrolase-fold protein [Microbacterium sp. NPDC089189]|uniref:alpha/beta hydrolase n=1 Tax=Microbacterium sp. NPDC089189 TaxID=3154972 RepID=UPI00341B2B94
MGRWLLSIDIVDPVLIGVCCALSALVLAYLTVRTGARRWVRRVVMGAVAGAAAAAIFTVFANVTGMFGMPLPWQAVAWGVGGLAAVGVAVVNLFGTRWWRRLIAAFGAVLFLVTTTLGINAYFGLNTTLASFLHISLETPIAVPTPTPGQTDDPGVPLYTRWQAPAGMPTTGKTGTVTIPATASGFAARPASLYTPPAALTDQAPLLPLVILMMGQPGDPDPQYIARTLDAYAAQHEGLAPYALVVDQLGDPTRDPACGDSAMYGAVETYVTKDVVAFARTLPVIQRPSEWIIAGYSNGGGCAFKYAAEHPEIWGNLLSVSGELFPGSEHPDETTTDVFGGSASAFEAAKPVSILQSGAVAYPDSWALFTAGENDPDYVSQARAGAAATAAAGWRSDVFVVPGAGHVVDALEGGLHEGFARLYPRLGLAPS